MGWSSLPPELVHLISIKFSSISDLIPFRGVCKAWRASASISHLPPQIPCFLLQPDPGATTLQFYSLTSGKTHIVNVPACHDQTISGSSNGYLLMQHSTNAGLSLLNPVTNCKVSLPFLEINMPSLVWASPDPVRTNDYTVCISGNAWTPKKSVFWRPGEMKWTTINKVSQRCCYHEGKCLSLSIVSKSLAIYDVATQTLSDVVQPPHDERPFNSLRPSTYLVMSAGQVILVLHHHDKRRPVDQCRFEVYRLEFGTEEKKPFWVKVRDIGNQILFLNVVHGFSSTVSASRFEGHRGNLIYFMKEEVNEFDSQSSYVLARYDMQTHKAEVLPFPPVTSGM